MHDPSRHTAAAYIRNYLKKRIHLPLIKFIQKVRGARYAQAPRKRAEELFQRDYGRPINWTHPSEFSEKMRWIQFNTDISQWSLLADKFNAREYVAEKGCADMLIPLYGHWEHASDIDFGSLPSSFVIKPNNGCADLAIVRDKAKAPLRKITTQLDRSLKTTYGSYTAETHYAGIKPAIIAESLLEEPGKKGLYDYKFFCTNGEPVMCMVCTDRDYNGPDTKRVTVYDMDWHRQDKWVLPHIAAAGPDIPRPASLDRMKEACRILAANIPFVRLDLYDVAGKAYFGEFTFTPAALKRKASLSDVALRLIADRITLPVRGQAPRLSVTISTIGADGIARVDAMNLPQVAGVEYVVSWQRHSGTPAPAALSNRPDIKIIRTDSVGLSNNRNNAIGHALGDIILIADDDLTYTPAQLQSVIDSFNRNPETDFATFKYDKPVYKTYPDAEIPYNRLPKGFHPVSFEIAFRRTMSMGADAISFDPRLGLGTTYLTCGEEDLFLMLADARGYKGRFFPIVITTHHGVPTGARKITDPGTLRAVGALIALRRPLSWLPAVIVNSWRTYRRGRAPLGMSLIRMTQGAIYARRHLSAH